MKFCSTCFRWNVLADHLWLAATKLWPKKGCYCCWYRVYCIFVLIYDFFWSPRLWSITIISDTIDSKMFCIWYLGRCVRRDSNLNDFSAHKSSHTLHLWCLYVYTVTCWDNCSHAQFLVPRVFVVIISYWTVMRSYLALALEQSTQTYKVLFHQDKTLRTIPECE